MCKYFLPCTAPLIKVTMSKIFSRLDLSLSEFLFATKYALDSKTLSIIFSWFCYSVVPVSVTSIIASTSSGGLASVAPKDKWICTFLFVPNCTQGVTI